MKYTQIAAAKPACHAHDDKLLLPSGELCRIYFGHCSIRPGPGADHFRLVVVLRSRPFFFSAAHHITQAVKCLTAQLRKDDRKEPYLLVIPIWCSGAALKLRALSAVPKWTLGASGRIPGYLLITFSQTRQSNITTN